MRDFKIGTDVIVYPEDASFKGTVTEISEYDGKLFVKGYLDRYWEEVVGMQNNDADNLISQGYKLEDLELIWVDTPSYTWLGKIVNRYVIVDKVSGKQLISRSIELKRGLL